MNPLLEITCPRCGGTLPIENIVQDRKSGNARGRCSQCKIWIPILLPPIRKKLVYVDQSFLSAACLEANKPNSKNEVYILAKLKKLKVQQKITVIVSDVHSRETSAIPNQYIDKSEQLWQFQNDLADGNIAGNWSDVFVAQQRRILAGQENSDFFPVTDIGINDPHRVQIGMRIQLTNNWQSRLHRDRARPRNTVNDAYRGIIEQQAGNIPRCKDVRDSLNYICELWHKNIREGIAAWRRQRDQHMLMEQIVKELEAGRIPAIPPVEVSTPFRQIVSEVVQGLDEEVALQRWLELLEHDSAKLSACMRIRIAFEAELLWKWRTGLPPTNPDTFNKGFGLSFQNDIDHISTFVPYVDALTTDNNMRDVCEGDIVGSELKRFPCKIFSKSNYEELEAWLDTLLAVTATHNVRE